MGARLDLLAGIIWLYTNHDNLGQELAKLTTAQHLILATALDLDFALGDLAHDRGEAAEAPRGVEAARLDADKAQGRGPSPGWSGRPDPETWRVRRTPACCQRGRVEESEIGCCEGRSMSRIGNHPKGIQFSGFIRSSALTLSERLLGRAGQLL